MKAALLIGNGLNRCYENDFPDISWSSLLDAIAKTHNVYFDNSNSFPLEFECLVNSIAQSIGESSDTVIQEVKEQIAAKVEKLTPKEGSIHHRYMALPISEVMTTNYDYMLERAHCADAKISKGSPAPKFSMKRNTTINGKRFHHIHGEALAATTLCLGYEHYAGYLAAIQNYVKNDLDIKETLFKQPLSDGISWLNLIFTHDIHIVGLTLGVCEIDLWWLLTYRAYLYNLDASVHRTLTNRITLYDTVKKPTSSQEAIDKFKKEQESRKNTFERLHVNYVPVYVTDSYLDKFAKIADVIEQKVGEPITV